MISDALTILQGEDNAATVYFRARSGADLTRRIMPIISRATDKTGLDRVYKEFNTSAARIYPDYEDRVDIDQYVLDHALNALFDRIATEEKLIRENPLKRSTDQMKKVFAYFAS